MDKISNILKLLEMRYGIQLDISNESHVAMVAEHYTEKKEIIRKSLGEHKAYDTPSYAKAYLISEAARMVLREIAPKRLKKKKG